MSGKLPISGLLGRLSRIVTNQPGRTRNSGLRPTAVRTNPRAMPETNSTSTSGSSPSPAAQGGNFAAQRSDLPLGGNEGQPHKESALMAEIKEKIADYQSSSGEKKVKRQAPQPPINTQSTKPALTPKRQAPQPPVNTTSSNSPTVPKRRAPLPPIQTENNPLDTENDASQPSSSNTANTNPIKTMAAELTMHLEQHGIQGEEYEWEWEDDWDDDTDSVTDMDLSYQAELETDESVDGYDSETDGEEIDRVYNALLDGTLEIDESDSEPEPEESYEDLVAQGLIKQTEASAKPKIKFDNKSEKEEKTEPSKPVNKEDDSLSSALAARRRAVEPSDDPDQDDDEWDS